jgi:hypothetical protein
MNLHVKIFLLRIAIITSSLITGLTVIAVAVYCYAWIAYVRQAQKQIDIAWENAGVEYNLAITGEKPDIKGFPFTPHVTYAGRITHNPTGFYADVPELTYRGFPAPTQIQELSTPKGFVLNLPVMGRTVTVTSASLMINWPRYLPMQFDKAAVSVWQKQNDPLVVHAIAFQTPDIKATGNGMIGLDESLQIAGYINLRIIGLEKLLTAAEGDSPSKPESMKTAKQFLQMLSHTDAATGETYFDTTLRLENKGVYFGPMKIAAIPEMPWETAHPVDVPRRQKP